MTNNNPGRTAAYNAGELLDEKEAASFLRLSPSTLRNWRYQSSGPTVTRVGKRAARYRFADLEAFIAESSAKVA